jgi:hypothetical protein
MATAAPLEPIGSLLATTVLRSASETRASFVSGNRQDLLGVSFCARKVSAR